MATALDELNSKADALQVVVGNIASQLYELKAALDTALLNGITPAAVQAVADRLEVMRQALVSAGTTTDITPETPVEPPPVAPPPVEPPVEPPVV